MNARRWITAALLLAAVGCRDSLLGPGPSQDRSALFDDVWHQFDLHYSFFELKGIDWTAVGDRYRPMALAAANDTVFAHVLAKMFDELHDVHVTLTPFGDGSTMRYVSTCDTVTTWFSPQRIESRYLTSVGTTSGGHIRYGQAAPGVWYLYIPSFEGDGWAGEMDEALAHAGDARALIIDVRDNGGGNKVLATDIAGRFADRQRTFGYIRLRDGAKHTDFSSDIAETVVPTGGRRFRNPVVVITGRRDFSSAENFALAMRALPNVMTVGDTTAGASGGPLVREMANGWTYQLSQWIEYTPSHHTYEGIGLAPDVTVKNTAAAASQQRDLVFERGLYYAQQLASN